MKHMTVNQLIKKLEKLQAAVGKSAEVTVEWETFQHPDVSHNVIKEVDWEVIGVDDGDGCQELKKDGTPKEQRVVTIRGFREVEP